MKHKRIVFIILALALLAAALGSCTKKDDTQISDFGLWANNFVEYDGWIYYSEWDSGELYKIKPSGGEKTRVGDFETFYFRIYEDKIYYSDAKYKVMRCVNLDGSAVSNQDEFLGGDKIYIVDGWVYSLTRDMVIYRTKTDGTERTVLGKGNVPCIDFYVDGEWIYFSAVKPVDKVWSSLLYKMRRDGSEMTQISQEAGSTIDYDDKWIYYMFSEGEGIYSSERQSIYKVSWNGAKNEKLTDCRSHLRGFYKVIGDWLYFEDYVDDAGLYKVNINDGESVKIVDSYRIGEVGIWGNWLVYLCIDLDNETNSGYLQMVRISDSENTDELIDSILADMDIEIRKYE